MQPANALTEPQGAAAAPAASKAGTITPALSLNYSFAKVVAIFTLTAGHWFTGTILWIPVTFGLFVFAFSSAYFTSLKYGVKVERGSFWRSKLERLGLRYWVILAFLAVVLVLKDRPVLHWHSLVHLFGLSGVLNWAGVRNQSGFGIGLWFFTLLLLFYIAYPYLAQLVRGKRMAAAVLAGGFVLAVWLEDRVKVGHELWLTTFAFLAGVVCGAHRPPLRPSWMLALTALLWGALLLLNVLGNKGLNVVLIAAAGLSLALWLTVARLPDWGLVRRVAAFDKYLLEIYLIHMYLFFRPTGTPILDFLLSLALIVAAAMVLSKISDRLGARLFDGGRAPRAA